MITDIKYIKIHKKNYNRKEGKTNRNLVCFFFHDFRFIIDLNLFFSSSRGFKINFCFHRIQLSDVSLCPITIILKLVQNLSEKLLSLTLFPINPYIFFHPQIIIITIIPYPYHHQLFSFSFYIKKKNTGNKFRGNIKQKTPQKNCKFFCVLFFF